ncbi:MAG: hypothetical protein WC707_07095 [Candidatus Babeliaceae bacterium]|jgi:hypothetical protein
MNVDKYKNTISYPMHPAKICDCGQPFGGNIAPNFCGSCGSPLKDEYNAKIEQYKELKKQYNEEDNRLLALFKVDALEVCGLTNHPKADKAYRLAWYNGTSDGLMQVYYELEELAELLL